MIECPKNSHQWEGRFVSGPESKAFVDLLAKSIYAEWLYFDYYYSDGVFVSGWWMKRNK